MMLCIVRRIVMSDEIKKTDNEKEELSEGVIAAAQAAPEEGSLIDDLLEWCEHSLWRSSS